MHLTSTLHCRTTSSELCGVSEGEEREQKNREGRGYKLGVCREKGITSQKEEVGKRMNKDSLVCIQSMKLLCRPTE